MGKWTINRQQLPVKAHYFFFMAAMGSIMPFLTVYGKQLGVSVLVMGSITAVLPLLFLVTKPAFGFLVDSFWTWRRAIFICLLLTTSGFYILLYFLPALPGPVMPDSLFQNASISRLQNCDTMKINVTDSCVDDGRSSLCTFRCPETGNSTIPVYFHSTREAQLSTNTSCLITKLTTINWPGRNELCDVSCDDSGREEQCLYRSLTFWGFVLFMCLGYIGYNVCNCIGDAICFDVLGEGGQMSYGRQRLWGSIGYGLTAFTAGYAMVWWSGNHAIMSYTPAFILVAVFAIIDILCCSQLQLPRISGTESIMKDVCRLIRIKPIVIFLIFAIIPGMLDSFIMYFSFWYLEDLAEATGYMHEIKLIEGLVVFAQTVGGEVIFFTLSGKILKKIGFGFTFALCFVCYALRLTLISLAPTPRWVVPIEFFMQGPTYALCYTTIVAYASAVAPPGTSATVQGIVVGMDDGLGFAIGSFVGGFLFKEFGGAVALRIYASLALVAAVAYFILHVNYLKHVMPKIDVKKKIQTKNPAERSREHNQCL